MSLESYSVGRIAGRGHQSVIYKAVRVADGQVCALKCVRLSALKSAAARQRVEEEVAILQSLEHPNIVKHRSLFHHQDDMYIELEWADGGDLKALLRRHAEAQMYMSELRVLGFFTQIASAVRHMHERRILHRDLKPANCLLLKEGMIKIADLGLGRHLDEDVDEAHSRVGTPLYMAPEILQSKSYNWSSDVWSMGVLLYELAALQCPFKRAQAEENDLVHVVARITRADYPAISARLPYSSQLRGLVRAMLVVEPAMRPAAATVCSLAQALLLATGESASLAPARRPAPPKDPPAAPLPRCRLRKYRPRPARPSPRSAKAFVQPLLPHPLQARAPQPPLTRSPLHLPSKRPPPVSPKHPSSPPRQVSPKRGSPPLPSPESPLTAASVVSEAGTSSGEEDGGEAGEVRLRPQNEGARLRAPSLHQLSIATTRDALHPPSPGQPPPASAASAPVAAASAAVAAPGRPAMLTVEVSAKPVNPFATNRIAHAEPSPKSAGVLASGLAAHSGVLFSPRSARTASSASAGGGSGSSSRPFQFTLWANAKKELKAANNGGTSGLGVDSPPHSGGSRAADSPKIAPKGYRLGDMLGEGSYARVYLAVDVRTGSLFAVKQMLMNDADNLAQMEKEISVLKELNHPNLVRYLGTERAQGGDLNVLLEYCNGGSIAQMLRQFHSFPEGLIRLYTRHMVEALAYLHQRGFVHRDVKGGNVLVNGHEARGVAKLSDFGCSKRILGQGGEGKSLGRMGGTVLWMAPEAARQDANAGAAADIWSLGATVIEMATGRPPWTEEGFSDSIPALLKIATTTVPPLFPANLSPTGADFLAKCMHVNPAARWTADRLREHEFLVLMSDGGKGLHEPQTPRTPSFALEAAARGRGRQEERDAALLLGIRQTIHGAMALITRTGGGESSKGWADVFSRDVECVLPQVPEDKHKLTGLPLAPVRRVLGLDKLVENFHPKEGAVVKAESTRNTNELVDHSSRTAMWRWEISGVVLENAKRFTCTGTASASFDVGLGEKGHKGVGHTRIKVLEVVWDVQAWVKVAFG